jgi:hypothetical protein
MVRSASEEEIGRNKGWLFPKQKKADKGPVSDGPALVAHQETLNVFS